MTDGHLALPKVFASLEGLADAKESLINGISDAIYRRGKFIQHREGGGHCKANSGGSAIPGGSWTFSHC